MYLRFENICIIRKEIGDIVKKAKLTKKEKNKLKGYYVNLCSTAYIAEGHYTEKQELANSYQNDYYNLKRYDYYLSEAQWWKRLYDYAIIVMKDIDEII